MDERYLKLVNERIQKARRDAIAKRRRHEEMGITHPTSKKAPRQWYTTRELVNRVQAQFDRMEGIVGRRVCYINNPHQLQIRGKHLRRLLKALPYVRQEGRMLVEDKYRRK